MGRCVILPVLRWVLLAWFGLAGVASGVVLHLGGAEPSDRPDDRVIVRWSTNASAVVIGPSWLLTTRHQNTSPSTVTIDGIIYNCRYHENWEGGPRGDADIRIVRLRTVEGEIASLEHYAPVYSTAQESGKYIVIGGYGKGRGAELKSDDITYGYEWGGSGNGTLRLGSNKVNYTIASEFVEGLNSDLIVADFDQLGSGEATYCEGACAEYDSGGGWFIKVGGQWHVAGLSRGVEHLNESRFLDPDGLNPDPDYMDAVRVSSYAEWIEENMTVVFCDGEIPGDLYTDCKIDVLDLDCFTNNWLNGICAAFNGWCDGADLEMDGDVDLSDFAILMSHWLECRLVPIEACDY